MKRRKSFWVRRKGRYGPGPASGSA